MKTFFFAAVFAVFALAGRGLAAHHFATSLAEADYNRETGKLEVALSVDPANLEWVLSRRAGKKVNLERTPNVDELIESYLSECFQVALPKGKKAKLEWVGKELEVKTAWLYFEFAVPGGIEGLKLANRVFLKVEADQVNTVNVRDGRFRTTLSCTRKASAHTLTKKKVEESEKGGDRSG